MISVAHAKAKAEIRARRLESNAAIIRHDVRAMKALFLPDATVLPGASGMPHDMTSFDARMSRAFADPAFVPWVRTPTAVILSGDGARAAESGTWTGGWQTERDTILIAGIYQAMWLPTPTGWLIQNESFIELQRGSSAEYAINP